MIRENVQMEEMQVNKQKLLSRHDFDTVGYLDMKKKQHITA